MRGERSLVLGLGTVLAAVLLAPVGVAAQSTGPFDVLVPDFRRIGEAHGGFSEDVAERLRDVLDDEAAYRAIEKKRIEDVLKNLGVEQRMRELDCILIKQLAQQMGANVYVCGTYQRVGDSDDELRVEVTFGTPQGSETFSVEPFVVSRRQDEEAAQHILESFQAYNDQQSRASWCAEYFGSEQYEDAMRNCDLAIEMNPDALSPRMIRAAILTEREQYEEALTEYERVIAVDPSYQDVLQNAGYVASQAGDVERARRYYLNYLEYDPGNVDIRNVIAYQLAEAGDFEGAMTIVQAGLEYDPENIELRERLSDYAFRAALREARQESAGGELSESAREFFRIAVENFEIVFEAKGAEIDRQRLNAAIRAYAQLGEYQRAQNLAQRGAELFPDAAEIWSVIADVYITQEQHEEALRALRRLREADPDYERLHLRMGLAHLRRGEVEDAVEALKRAVERGSVTADAAADRIFRLGYEGNLERQPPPRPMEAVRPIELALEFEVSPEKRAQYNFFLGYAHFYQAKGIYDAAVEKDIRTQAAEAKKALPLFQEAMGYFNRASGFSSTAAFIENTTSYIAIQEALIRRGGG